MKNISIPIKIITLYNLTQTLATIYIISSVFPTGWYLAFLILFVLVANYFLVLKKKAAWTSLLIWYILITFSFTSAVFFFNVSYGIYFYLDFKLNLNGDEIIFGIDFFSLIILIIHLFSKKDFNRKKMINEIDQISKNHDQF